MYTFIKSTYYSYYIIIQKRVSGIQSGFGYPRVSILEMNFDPNRCSGRVRVLSSGFGSRCSDTLPIRTRPVDIASWVKLGKKDIKLAQPNR